MVLSLVEAQCADPELSVALIVLNEGRLSSSARAAGIPVRLHDELAQGASSLVKSIRESLREISPHIIHSHRYKEHFVSFLVARDVGAQPICTIHGHEREAGALRRFQTRVRDSVIFFLGARARARYAAVSSDLRSRYDLPETRTVVIPNGVILRDIERQCEERIRRIGNSERVLGWVGRLVEIKDVPLLLDTFALLRQRGLSTTLTIVGDGPEKQRLSEHAGKLGISDQIDWTGYVADARSYYDDMDVFVLTSKHEGLPIAMLEAMASGVPVVAARVGGIPEVVGATGSATLVDSRRPEVWADAIESLLTQREVFIEHVKRGRALLEERFSRERMVGGYTQLYRDSLRWFSADRQP
jgi:glycosyltransferase involved in cell wall biosynthesis